MLDPNEKELLTGIYVSQMVMLATQLREQWEAENKKIDGEDFLKLAVQTTFAFRERVLGYLKDPR
jgi:hypothetical protein